ncbi:MAG: hypothetical protein HRU13_05945 [Phycisphaerales bacterium]|nr:hypothetical protein [Phycisphaerales bacterium]
MARLCIAIALLFASTVLAHPTLKTMVFVEVSRDDAGGVVEVRVLHDVLAYVLNDTSAAVLDWQMYELLEATPQDFDLSLQYSRERFEGGFWILADGERLDCELVQSPTPESVDQWRLKNPQLRLPIAMYFTLRARLPQGTQELAVRGPYVMDEMMLVVRRPGQEETYLNAAAAEPSEPFNVSMATTPIAHTTAAHSVEAHAAQPATHALSMVAVSLALLASIGVLCCVLVRPRRLFSVAATR